MNVIAEMFNLKLSRAVAQNAKHMGVVTTVATGDGVRWLVPFWIRYQFLNTQILNLESHKSFISSEELSKFVKYLAKNTRKQRHVQDSFVFHICAVQWRHPLIRLQAVSSLDLIEDLKRILPILALCQKHSLLIQLSDTAEGSGPKPDKKK